MIKRVKQTKVLVVVLFLCSFIIVAYAYLNANSIWKPRRVQFYNFPKNYVYKKKNITAKKQGPGLRLTNLPTVLVNESQNYFQLENNFFKFLEQKDIICDDDSRHGNQHDGGWNVCMSPPFNLKKPCLVYSFGIGRDWRFEDDVHDRYGCTIRAFDPSIHLIEHNRTGKIWFKPVGLGAKNRVTEEKWRLKTFKELLIDQGDEKTVIDFLKFDIENMEWNVLFNLIEDQSLALVKQLAFEIHLHPPTRTADKGSSIISKEDFVTKYSILELLEAYHFKKFNYRLNPFCMYKSRRTSKSHSFCYELHYVNFRFVREQHLKPRNLR